MQTAATIKTQNATQVVTLLLRYLQAPRLRKPEAYGHPSFTQEYFFDQVLLKQQQH